MKLPRRNLLQLAASAAALPAVSRFAWAQAYPSRHASLPPPVPAVRRTLSRGSSDHRSRSGWASSSSLVDEYGRRP